PVNWQLNPEQGERLVEVEVSDGTTTQIVSDTIQLDTGAPSTDTATPTNTPTPTEVFTSTPINTEIPATTTAPTSTLILSPTNTGEPPTVVTPTITPTPSATLTPPLNPTDPACTTCLEGQVSLEGRPQPPDPRWVMPLAVQLIRQGAGINSNEILTFTP